MSDNGMYLEAYGLVGKWFGFEKSIKVPLIIYNPRNKSKRNNIDDIALNIDIVTTFLWLADVDNSKQMQDVDLIENKKSNYQKAPVFYEHKLLGFPKLPKVEGVVSTKTK